MSQLYHGRPAGSEELDAIRAKCLSLDLHAPVFHGLDRAAAPARSGRVRLLTFRGPTNTRNDREY